MQNTFEDVMSARTNEQLIKIITIDRGDYQPLAIEAAEAEIKKRGIKEDNIEHVKAGFIFQKEEERLFDLNKASITQRLIHYIIDNLIIWASILLLFIIFSYLFNGANPDLLYPPLLLMIPMGYFGYYIFMEINYQKTIGKFITKTSVVTKNGRKPEVKDIVLRTFSRLIPFNAISFLFIRDGFHDRQSETTVVRDN